MWPFNKTKRYMYFKSVCDHYYGLCGVTINYTKERRCTSTLKYMIAIRIMENKGFKEITKHEYLRGLNKCTTQH